MRALIAAGGTAGHINPALAVADEIKKNEPDSEILFVGCRGNLEEKLVKAAGYAFRPIEMHCFIRSFRLKYILWNLRTLYFVFTAQIKTRRLIKKFRPDVAIGTGGFVSGPVLRTAARMRVRTAVHEQNAFPGLTNKLLAKDVDIIFLAMDDAAARIGHADKCHLVGNPVSSRVLSCDRSALRRANRIDKKLCVLSFGGSLGAAKINEAMEKIIVDDRADSGVYHIHATGAEDWQNFCSELGAAGVDIKDTSRLRVSEYINDMPECLAMADIVVSRSGAITVSELAAAGKASILIPSPNVTENHQYYNALALKNAGAALIIEEKDLTPESLAESIRKLGADRGKLTEMGVRARSIAVTDAAARIYRYLKKLTSVTE